MVAKQQRLEPGRCVRVNLKAISALRDSETGWGVIVDTVEFRNSDRFVYSVFLNGTLTFVWHDEVLDVA